MLHRPGGICSIEIKFFAVIQYSRSVWNQERARVLRANHPHIVQGPTSVEALAVPGKMETSHRAA